MDDFFKMIREEVSPAIWSKGVELARQDAVTGDEAAGGEIKLRVLNKNGAVSPTVTLSIDEGDWHCTCGGPDDPCAHVAAAVIALKRAREQGRELPRSESNSGKVLYRLSRAPTGLLFERVVRTGSCDEVLTVALSALVSGRVKGPQLTATAEDLQIEVALGSNRRGLLPAATWPALIKALARGVDVTLDGQELRFDAAPVGLAAVVTDEGPGVRVRIEQDPAITELFANGAALCGQTLRPVLLPTLSPNHRELLRPGRLFGKRDAGEVAGALVPALAARMPVIMQAKSLPSSEGSARAQIIIDLQASGDNLLVEAQLHYGRPPFARVKDGRLITAGERVPRRDEAEEARLKDELRLRLNLEIDQIQRLPADAAGRFIQRLERTGWAISGPGKEAFAQHPPLAAQLQFHGLEPQLSFRSASADGAATKHADAAAVMAAWQRGESLVPLLEGGFAPLPSAWLAAHGDRILEFLAARGNGERPLATATLPLLAELGSSCGQTLPAELERRCRLLLAPGAKLPAARPRPPLCAVLRPYQELGVEWLSTLKELGMGALLADDMGLGKTLQALAVVDGRTLVVAPTSVLFNWQAEARKFRPDLKLCLYHGAARRLDEDASLVLTTYALLRLDQDQLCAKPWQTLIFDEAQALKNPDSQGARAAQRLRASFRLAMSGTPVENHLEDLWSVMQLLNPGLLGDRRFFHEHYVKRIELGDHERGATLRRRLKPCLLRRLKSEVVPDLPPRTETLLYVELTPAERDRYDMIRAATRRDVLEQLASGGSVLAALEALLRLRQASCHGGLLPHLQGTVADSAKLSLLVETLLTSADNGHQTLVFSQWTSFLDLMEPALQAAGLTYLRLDGSTVDRQSVVEQFQAKGGPPVLLMSLKAGGVGLNLTAADHVMITDPWWNPAAEDQASDRAHRIGQERPVLIQRLVSLGTVEERILLLQEKKRALARAAVDDSSTALGGTLSREDLLALLD